jgi:hypothetical protein
VKAIHATVVVAILLTACTGGGKHTSSSSPITTAAVPSTRVSSSPVSAAALPPAQATAIQAALGDGSPAKVETILEPSVRSAFAQAPTRLLPAGSTVKVDAASMRVQGERAVVSAVVTTLGKATAYKLLLIKVDGTWLVYGTSR